MTEPVPGLPASPAPVLVDGVNVVAVAAAVRGCPGVQDLYAGNPEAVAVYLPGRRIGGVRIGSDHVVISVRAQWDVPAAKLAAQIRVAVGGLVSPRRIDIVIADLADVTPVRPARPAGDELWSEAGTWTSGSEPGGNSSGLTIPTTAGILPPSSAA